MTDYGQRIGFVGLGKMGTPMCRRIAEAGFRVTAYARNPAGEQRAKSIRVDAVTSLSDLASKSDIIVSAIPDDRALYDVILSEDGLRHSMRRGMTLVETSTVSPEISTQVADVLQSVGVEYLCAPISGSTAMADSGALTVMASGSSEIFERMTPLLASFSKRQYLVGSADQARYMKLVLNAMVGATSAIVAEALRIGRKGGIKPEVMLEVINNSAVASPLIRYKTDMLVSGNFTPAFSVNQMIKDFDILLDVGKETHCPLHVMALIRQLYESSFDIGNGDRDFFVLSEAGDLAPAS